jgi:hypothetical protein
VSLPIEILIGALLFWQMRLAYFNVTNQEVTYFTHQVMNYNKYQRKEDEEPVSKYHSSITYY